jgi:hypothetical protein
MQKLTTEDTKAHRAAKAAKRLETSVFLCGKAFDLDLWPTTKDERPPTGFAHSGRSICALCNRSE